MKLESLLKPCPFCGSEAYIAETWDTAIKYVQCTTCGCRTVKLKNRLEAIELWNRRASPEESGKSKSK